MSQDNESELVQHPHHMGLWGWPGDLDFPPLCPNCGAFEAVRFICTMRDAGFAAAFKEINHQRAYRPSSPRAQADQQVAKRKFRLWVAFVVAIALYFIVKDWLP